MNGDIQTINQWVLRFIPGLTENVRAQLGTTTGNIQKKGPILEMPEHFWAKLPDVEAHQLPNTFIKLNLALPIPTFGAGLEEFLERTLFELAENSLREFVEADRQHRAEGTERTYEFLLSVDSYLKQVEGQPLMYAIQILDNGRGMPKDLVQYILNHIAEQRGKPYQLPLDYRCEESGKAIGGYGIIMAVNYVFRLKGAFSIRSVAGKGSKIRMDIPVENWHRLPEFFPELMAAEG